MKLFSVLIVFSILMCCAENVKKEQTDELEYTFLKDPDHVNLSIIGYWKSIGNGYYLEARKDSIFLYSYTNNFCYKEKNDYLEGLLNTESQFRQGGDTLSIYLTDYGEETEQLQNKKDFLRVEKLPDDCMGFDEMRGLPTSELFRLYWETIDENYAFKERRNLDLDLIFDRYKDSVLYNSDSRSLFNTLGEIAILTKDHHTKVIKANGERLQYSVTPSAQTTIEVFEEQDEIEDLNTYFNLFFETNYRNISEDILKGQGEKVLNGKLEWGSTSDNIGYLNIHSFTGFTDSGLSRKQQIDSLKFHMENIITAFQDKDAIIIDVGFNFGGYDASGLSIASYFTDQPVKAYTSQVYYENGFYDEDEVVVHPASSIRFTKPVYLLMTDISRSAAESFAMMMDALPNVTIVGTNSLGILSGMLGKSIGDFYTTFSNQRLLARDGRFYEGTGVEPDIKIEVFPKENIFNGHRLAVQKVIELIKNK